MADNYEIKQVIERKGVSIRGAFELITEIYFVTAEGNAGSVEIPSRGLTPEIAQEAIEEKAAVMDAIKAL